RARSLASASCSKGESSSIGGVMFPPLLEERPGSRQEALDGFLGASGLRCHIPDASFLPIPPQQDDAINLGESLQHLFGLSPQSFAVERLVQQQLRGRIGWILALGIVGKRLAQPAAI